MHQPWWKIVVTTSQLYKKKKNLSNLQTCLRNNIEVINCTEVTLNWVLTSFKENYEDKIPCTGFLKMSPHVTLDFTILKLHCLTNELWGYEDTTQPNPQVSPLKGQDPWLWTLGWSRAIVNLQQTGERKEEDRTHSVFSSQPHYQGKLSFLLGELWRGQRPAWSSIPVGILLYRWTFRMGAGHGGTFHFWN